MRFFSAKFQFSRSRVSNRFSSVKNGAVELIYRCVWLFSRTNHVTSHRTWRRTFTGSRPTSVSEGHFDPKCWRPTFGFRLDTFMTVWVHFSFVSLLTSSEKVTEYIYSRAVLKYRNRALTINLNISFIFCDSLHLLDLPQMQILNSLLHYICLTALTSSFFCRLQIFSCPSSHYKTSISKFGSF